MAIQRPILLSKAHVAQALADEKFYTKLPEYTTLQAKLKAMHVDLKSKRGCGSCKQKRASSNLYSDFVAITAGLSSEGANRLKRYLNAPALMLNVVDVSGHVAIKTM